MRAYVEGYQLIFNSQSAYLHDTRKPPSGSSFVGACFDTSWLGTPSILFDTGDHDRLRVVRVWFRQEESFQASHETLLNDKIREDPQCRSVRPILIPALTNGRSPPHTMAHTTLPTSTPNVPGESKEKARYRHQ